MIPPTAFFIWFGRELSFMHALSVRSALRNGGFEHVTIFHDGPLSGAGFDSLPQDSRLKLRLIDWNAIADSLPESLRPIVSVASGLTAARAKANVLRAMLLAAEGGVYIDMDFITLRSFGPLCREAGAFYGTETVAFTAEIVHGTNIPHWALAYMRTAVRDLFRRLPSGWRAFRKIEHFYPKTANNAVLGSEPNHPFVHEMLRRMIATDQSQLRVPYVLGTHLLQSVVKETWPGNVVRCPPAMFFPFGPEISEHWFRIIKAVSALDEVLFDETLGVHWYASVRTKKLVPKIDESYIRTHKTDQLFSALVARALGL